jgi:hypothetical protein
VHPKVRPVVQGKERARSERPSLNHCAAEIESIGGYRLLPGVINFSSSSLRARYKVCVGSR